MQAEEKEKKQKVRRRLSCPLASEFPAQPELRQVPLLASEVPSSAQLSLRASARSCRAASLSSIGQFAIVQLAAAKLKLGSGTWQSFGRQTERWRRERDESRRPTEKIHFGPVGPELGAEVGRCCAPCSYPLGCMVRLGTRLYY